MMQGILLEKLTLINKMTLKRFFGKALQKQPSANVITVKYDYNKN